MVTFFDSIFWLNFVWFVIACFFAFFIPGDVVLGGFVTNKFHKGVLALVIGMVVWSLQGFLFGFLQMRWLTYCYLLITFILWIKAHPKPSVKSIREYKWIGIDKFLLVIFALGTFVQLIIVWFIGVYTSKGLYFCCFWPDSLYHIALTNQLVKNFPPFEPGMSGVVVENYHYLSNLMIAELVRVFHLPLVYTQYQYSTLLLTVLMGLSVVVFCEVLHLSQQTKRWMVFFLYFSGDLIFILLHFLGKGLQFDLTLPERAVTLWFSPSRVYSLTFLFGAMSLIPIWIKTAKIRTGVVIAMVIGSLIGFKVYTGLFALVGCGFLILYFLFRKKWKMLSPLVLVFVISGVLFSFVNRDAGGLYFIGLWRIEDFAVRPLLGLISFEQARMVYMQHHNYPKVFLIELFYGIIYSFSLLGIFLLGFLQNKKSLFLLPKELHIFLISGLLVTTVAGMFFFQKTGGGNSFQFLFSIYLVGIIYTALACANIFFKRKGKFWYVFVVIVILSGSGRTIQRTYANTLQVISGEGFYVNSEELQALAFIKTKTASSATILVDQPTAEDNICYYISFLSQRNMYLCGSGILQDHGVDIQQRVQVVRTVFKNTDRSNILSALKATHADYIYVRSPNTFQDMDIEKELPVVFKNNSITIFKTK